MQVTTPPDSEQAELDRPTTKVAPTGSGSLTVTFFAWEGPALEAKRSQVIVDPATAESVVLFMRDKSAEVAIGVLTDALLGWPTADSGSSALAAAELARVLPLAWLGSTLIETASVSDAPTPIAAQVHSIVPAVVVQEPPEDVDPTVVPAGSRSVRTTLLAVAGPLFVTVMR